MRHCFAAAIANRENILTEGALIERIRREYSVPLDPHVVHTSLLYSDQGRQILSTLWREYLDIGRAHEMSMLVCTATWRATAERLRQAGLPGVKAVSRDAVAMLAGIRAEYGRYGERVYVGGLLGCRGDAYLPQQALDAEAAERFHSEQAEALAAAGVDFLLATPLPALCEALGMARALAATGAPYLLNFVLRPNGELLDGTPLAEAIARIDDEVESPPAAFLAGCTHPANVCSALAAAESARPGTCKRLVGVQGNSSRKSPEELNEGGELQTGDVEEFVRSMRELRNRFGAHVQGGCCGTNASYIAALASDWTAELLDR